MKAILLAWTGVLVVACSSSSGGGGGGGGATVSCTTDGSGGAPLVCTEATGLSSQQVTGQQQTCVTMGPIVKMFANGPCSRTNAVAGCQQVTGGVTQTDWYYSPMYTAASVQMNCAATVVQP